MTQDEIIELYKKANGWSPAGYLNTLEELERFAALVAAHEREKQAEQEPVAITVLANGLHYGVEFLDQVPLGAKLYAAPVSVEVAVLAEREACAKVCEDIDTDSMVQNWKSVDYCARECAEAIRARSEK